MREAWGSFRTFGRGSTSRGAEDAGARGGRVTTGFRRAGGATFGPDRVREGGGDQAKNSGGLRALAGGTLAAGSTRSPSRPGTRSWRLALTSRTTAGSGSRLGSIAPGGRHLHRHHPDGRAAGSAAVERSRLGCDRAPPGRDLRRGPATGRRAAAPRACPHPRRARAVLHAVLAESTALSQRSTNAPSASSASTPSSSMLAKL